MTLVGMKRTTVLLLLILPSAVFAECKGPIVAQVNVQLPNVSWTGTFEPSCMTGFQVCWGHIYGNDVTVSCEMVSPEFSSMLIDDVQPCEYVRVQVLAIGKGNLTASSKTGYGSAAPPKIVLRTIQQSRDMTTFYWSSLSDYSCVENVRLWVCDNRTQDRTTCFFANLYSETTKVELYDFQVCRYYYAHVCAEHLETCRLSTLRFYLDSANELTSVETINITHNSAIVKWWVSDVNFTCQTEKMRICYQQKNNDTSPECWSWMMGQVDSSDSIKLTDLDACATYSAVVSLRTAVKYSHQTVTFTTPMMGDVIEAAAGNMTDTSASVTWSFDADRDDCQPDNMQVCYSAVGSDRPGMCRSLATAAHSSVRLHNLAVCTRYDVTLTLLTASSPQPTKMLQLTTLSTGHPVLESMITTAVGTTVKVEWTPVNSSLQCVSIYNVSWYSSDDLRKTWQALSTSTTYFTILLASRGQTYYVEVAAVFVDGTSESLFQHVDVPAQSGSPSTCREFSSANLMATTILLVGYFH